MACAMMRADTQPPAPRMFRRRKTRPGKSGENPLASRVVRGDDRPTEPLEEETARPADRAHGRRTPDPEATVQVSPPRQPGRLEEPATRLVDPPDANDDAMGPGHEMPAGILLVLRGPNRGTLLPVRPGVSDFGSGDQASFPVDSDAPEYAPERHAVLTCDADHQRFMLQPLGGHRPVVDGQPVHESMELRDGARLRFGASEFLFRILLDPHDEGSRMP